MGTVKEKALLHSFSVLWSRNDADVYLQTAASIKLSFIVNEGV